MCVGLAGGHYGEYVRGEKRGCVGDNEGWRTNAEVVSVCTSLLLLVPLLVAGGEPPFEWG